MLSLSKHEGRAAYRRLILGRAQDEDYLWIKFFNQFNI